MPSPTGGAERGIAVCGSGIGISIAVNRNPPAAARASTSRCRPRSPASITTPTCIALGARLIGSDMAKACVAAFLATDFAGGRHQRRVDQLSQLLQESD